METLTETEIDENYIKFLDAISETLQIQTDAIKQITFENHLIKVATTDKEAANLKLKFIGKSINQIDKQTERLTKSNYMLVQIIDEAVVKLKRQD
tara:strand:+ start:1665 stop:1949 length:285 start_codon:yes stop_codon:yes gene_type:complete